MKIGDCLGDNQRYELLKRLGKGGQGDVWMAVDKRLQRKVAIKTLKTPWDNKARARFEREATSLAGLKHPNIVQIYDFGLPSSAELEESEAYLVIEYIEGETLRRYIEQTSHKGTFPSATDILYLFGTIGEALDFAHQAGIIHRDIKPDNILLDKRNTMRNAMGRPVLTDFGLVKLQDVLTLTGINVGLGTWGYSSPEQLMGKGVSHFSDIYSLGVILYEMCTGKRPFQYENESPAFYLQYQGIFAAPNQVNSAISPALNAVILSCMNKEPEKRFPNAKSMVEALAEALSVPFPDSTIKPIEPIESLEPPIPPDEFFSTGLDDSSLWRTIVEGKKRQDGIDANVRPPDEQPVLLPPPPAQPPASPRRRAEWRRRNVLLVSISLVLVALIIVVTLGLQLARGTGTGKTNTPSTTPTASQYGVSVYLQSLLHSNLVDSSLNQSANKGGLDNDLLWQAESIMYWSLSAKYHRTATETQTIHEQIGDILYYLDGQCAAQKDFNNVPPGYNGINADALVSTVHTGLFDCNAAGYLTRITVDLNGIMHATNATPRQRSLAGNTIKYIPTINSWLQNVRNDAVVLINMAPNLIMGTSAASAYSKIENMVLYAQYAYGGHVDPEGILHPGVSQVYDYIQQS